MATPAILTRKITTFFTKLPYSPFSSHLLPHIPFSSLCKRTPLSLSSSPPIPKRVPCTLSAHGTTWQDPYHWMSNTNDPDLTNYLNHENLYTQGFMDDTGELQRELLLEIKSRMPISVSTPPELWGPWLYYHYIPEGKEYPVLCRKFDTLKSGWMKKLVDYAGGGCKRQEVLLDGNEIAEKFGYVHVGTSRVSPDHNFIAYTLDSTGGEQFILQIKDLRSGCIIPKLNVNGVVSLAWAKDSQTLFYTTSDETQRPYRVLYLRVGSDTTEGVPIFTESDSAFCVDISSTKDGKFITVYVLKTDYPQDQLQRVRKRVCGTQYFLEHHHDFFYILTNAPMKVDIDLIDGGYYLARCRTENIQSGNWQSIILPGQDESFHDMDIFEGHLVLFLNRKGSSTICSVNMPIDENYKHPMKVDDLNPWFFPMPSSLCGIVPGTNRDFMTSVYRAVLSSPVMPDVIVDYNMTERNFTILHQEDVPGITDNTGSSSLSFDSLRNIEKVQSWKDLAETFSYERREVTSHDGVQVPLTILYSREAYRKGESPGILLGYGAYGEVLDERWCAHRLSLLDRGWLVAFADVRGGGGANSSWHKSGAGSHKLNSIHDFVACGNYLVNDGYVPKDQLCSMAFSAGGLLVGAAMNMYPDLFRTAILKVPFLDVCNTLLDSSLPLTLLDHQEFGDPRVQTQFELIHSYSPYDNIPLEVCHPSMLVTASFQDSRVGVWEAAKWVAKVRENMCSSCSRSVILKTNMSGGHFGEGGRYSQCEESAFEYAFLIKATGLLETNNQTRSL